MATTGAKATSVEAVLDALRQHPDATAAELAEHAGIGRSTATRTLANLETQGRVTRQRGKAEAGGRTAPDRWALVPDTPKDPDETEQPATEQPAAEQPDTSMSASQDQGHAGRDTPPSSADIASAETEETTTDAAEPTSKDSSQRLRPGSCAPSSTPGWPSGPARSSPRPRSVRSWAAAPGRSATRWPP